MVSIILSHPQMGENIGAAARAMCNFGLTDLRLVAPRDGWPNERATATSSGALEHVKVQTFDTLAQSIDDLHYTFATTARCRDMVKKSYTPETAVEEMNNRQASNQNIGIVFGAERTGLLNDEISLCQAILSFPVNPDFSSLNLGQSVLLISYEIYKRQTSNQQKPMLDMGDSFPAVQKDVNSFLSRLESDLEEKNFFRSEDLKPTIVRNIQNIFTRADITDQEIRTLHGVLSALRGNKSTK